ncbi:YcdB/YcdC domain-containing protein [Caldalkalibacillus salinus]|uniref:YcdB/YcdC domain-containing protein n=1 Tax=Caldalkalibacillus salinus TaxID=2803787 RepID=UPI001924E05D|nr:S-layer homology domain-containing protein [Caldalkalibacillus salinus]
MKWYVKPVVAMTLSTTLVTLPAMPTFAQSFDEKQKQMYLNIQSEIDEQPDEGALEREQAVIKAQELISIPSGYEVQNTRYQSANQWNTVATWHVTFTKQEDENMVGEIRVSLNALSGELVNFHHYDRELETPSYPPTVSKGEAEAISNAFIEDVLPTKSSLVTYDPFGLEEDLPIIDSSDTYRFQYVRMHDGVPFPQHYITVEVTTDGHVVSLYSEWDEKVQFPEHEAEIVEENVIDTYQSLGSNQLELYYIEPERSEDDTVYLSYRWNTGHPSSISYVDARSGEPLNQSLDVIDNTEPTYVPISEEPLEAHFSGGAELTEEEALQHVLEVTPIDESAVKVSSSSYSSNDYNGRSVWNFQFEPQNQEEGQHYWGYVSVDTHTGKIYDFLNESSRDIETDQDEAQQSLSDEELINKVISTTAKLSPETAHSTFYIDGSLQRNDQGPLAHVRLIAKENDVLIGNHPTSVTINQYTGDIVNFSAPRMPAQSLPKPDQVIEQEEALNEILEQSNITLQYQADRDYTKDVHEAKLVYELRLPNHTEPLFLNAETGEWHTLYSGEAVNLNRITPTDIDNHWAEDALMMMYDYRAIDTDENGHVRPNEKIKRGEMIKMLILAMNRGTFRGHYGLNHDASFEDVAASSRYFQYVEAAVDLNILDPEDRQFNPEDVLTREDMAVLVVRALGYDKLAQQKDLFNLDAHDHEAIEHSGHAAIVSHLDILTLQNGQFSPKREMTRAEAATVFQRFLEKRHEFAS